MLSVDMFQMEDKLEYKAEILNNGGRKTNGFHEEELIVKLYNVGSFKFGTFKMRNGEESPVYVDLRVLWSYPELVVAVSELMWKKCVEVIGAYDMQLDCVNDYFVCGVPYQGIPFATYMSTHYGLRMLLKRQEAKKYGTCHILEGNYEKGDRVIMVDDVLMTGGTLVDDIPLLEREGLKVEFGLVFIDRQQGGKKRVKQLVNKEVHSVLDLNRVFTVLLSSGKIDQETFDKTCRYLEQNRFDTDDYGVNVL